MPVDEGTPFNPPSQPGDAGAPWMLSGTSPQALRVQAAGLSEFVAARPDIPPEDVALSLREREAGAHRTAMLGRDRDELLAAARAASRGEPSPHLVSGRVRTDTRPVLVFPGQGWQWVGMAAELATSSPAFAKRLNECEAALRGYTSTSIAEAVTGSDAGWLDDVEVMQPALWAVMVSLAHTWEAAGITPAAVVGHSQGEAAAAVVAGALSLEDGARLVTAYARAIKQDLSGRGGMVAVGLSAAAARQRIEPWRDHINVAIVNGPSSTLLSGEVAALAELLTSCEAEGIWARRIAMDYAPHSPQVDAVTDRLAAEFADIAAMPCRIPFYSTVTGGLIHPGGLDVAYWVANLRRPIRLVDAIRSMLDDGYRIFVESSAHPVLTVGMQETFDEAGAAAVALGTLRRDDGGLRRFNAAVAELWTNGVTIDGIDTVAGANRIDLPIDVLGAGEQPVNEFARLGELSRGGQYLAMLDLVRRHAAAALGHGDPTLVGDDISFRDAGIDSPRAVALRTSLNAATGLQLPAAVAYSCPTPAALAERLRAELSGESDAPANVSIDPVDAAEPIAIVGMACRYPGGVTSPEDLWRLVSRGVDAIGDFPADRGWDLSGLHDPNGGTCHVDQAGFLEGVGEFDAAFFGISPREAMTMDPQQRLMLEVSWEALERAGIDPATLRGADVGVFTGASPQEYGSRLDQAPEGYEGQVVTGSANSVVSGRVAYALGWQGPAVTVDTACSSSLVALHLAAQSLRAGDCSLALASGVTVMSRPGMFIEFSRLGGLAADGRCKSFAAAADGTNWAEGVGVLVVERLSDARRNGHRVLAVVRGSAINQDGASNGLAAPSGPAQERVIRRALAGAGLTGDDVDAVEAHGTGTGLGDPIEAQALLATYGRDREPGSPLYLGSLKSNIGHAQAAAGVGGVIKMVMAMHEGMLPATLHVDAPSPHIDWSAGTVELLTRSRQWPERGRPRRAAVSSFGISGTNSHVIVDYDANDAAMTAGADTGGPVAWPVSARTGAALAAAAGSLSAFVTARPALSIGDIGFSLATTRTTMKHRAVVVGRDRAELLGGLATIADGGELGAQMIVGAASASGSGPVFVFPGQGAQWAGMGLELAQQFPVFAAALQECAQALRPLTGWDLRTELAGELKRVEVVQPASWAVMVSLARLWESFGVSPAAVVGHSQGEIAAAVVAGALSLDDGAAVVTARSTVISAGLAGYGAMASIGSSVEDVHKRLVAWDERISVAAVNGSQATAVSGDAEAVDALVAECEAEGLRAKRIPVDYASHSPQVETIRRELLDAIAGIRPQPSRIPIHSTVTCQITPGTELDAQYWYRNLRQSVRLEPVVRSLLALGHNTFIEASSHTVLRDSILQTAEDAGTDILAVGSLRRDDGGARRFLSSLAEAHVHGIDVDWSAAGAANVVDLPTYPFQRDRFWLTPQASQRSGQPLEAVATPLAETDGAVLTASLSLRSAAWLADHVVNGQILVPGTTFVEVARRAGETLDCAGLADLTFVAPLSMTESDRIRLQVVVGEPESAPHDGRRPVAVYAAPDDDATATDWRCHAKGTLAPARAAGADDVAFGIAKWPPVDATPIDVVNRYASVADLGYEYGRCFRTITAAWRRGDELFAEVELPADHHAEAGRFGIHPALLDAALHGSLLDGMDGGRQTLALPFAISGVELFTTGASVVRVRLTPTGDGGVSAAIADATGAPVARVDSFVLRRLPGGMADTGLFTVDWVDIAEPTPNGERPPTVTSAADLAKLSEPIPDTVVARLGELETGDAVSRAWDLAREWLRQQRFAESCLMFSVDDAGPAASAVAGLVRSAVSEHPGRFAILHGREPVSVAGEPELALRDGRISVPRLARVRPETAAAVPHVWDAGKTVLITGGTGTVGGLIARHLVAEHGVRHLLLVSRRGPRAPGAAELNAELRRLGADADIVADDLADLTATRAVLQRIPGSRPLGTVIHAAGVLDDALLESMTRDQLERVLRAKTTAAHLDELTADLDLDGFVLLSSIAGVIGMPGQANYAAASGYLDGLARDRRHRGLPGLSIRWGLWRQSSGMTAHLDEQDLARVAASGVATMSSEAGLKRFDACMRLDLSDPIAANLDLPVLRERSAQGEPPAIFRGLLPTKRRISTAPSTQSGTPTVVGQLAGASRAERERVLLTMVRSHAAAVLRLAPGESVEPDHTFRESGFDSLTAVDLRNRLNNATGLRLPSTVAFRHPTPVSLADCVYTELFGDEGAVPPPVIADLDRLRGSLAGLAADDDGRAEALAGLRELLREYDSTTTADGAGEDLAAATDDEMFALIDKELGID